MVHFALDPIPVSVVAWATTASPVLVAVFVAITQLIRGTVSTIDGSLILVSKPNYCPKCLRSFIAAFTLDTLKDTGFWVAVCLVSCYLWTGYGLIAVASVELIVEGLIKLADHGEDDDDDDHGQEEDFDFPEDGPPAKNRWAKYWPTSSS